MHASAVADGALVVMTMVDDDEPNPDECPLCGARLIKGRCPNGCGEEDS